MAGRLQNQQIHTPADCGYATLAHIKSKRRLAIGMPPSPTLPAAEPLNEHKSRKTCRRINGNDNAASPNTATPIGYCGALAPIEMSAKSTRQQHSVRSATS